MWDELLDFVGLLAHSMDLSGWSLGVRDGDIVHTHNRGFSAEVSSRYATISVDSPLPGPETLRTGRDQFFGSREEAHLRYPEAAAIDDGSVHQGSAVLALRAPHSAVPVGYLALHFPAARQVDERERPALRRVAATVETAIDRAARRDPIAQTTRPDAAVAWPHSCSLAMKRHHAAHPPAA